MRPEAAPLTKMDRRRLAAFKWRYELEAALENRGFSPDQARHLIFVRWLLRTGRLSGAPAPGRRSPRPVNRGLTEHY